LNKIIDKIHPPLTFLSLYSTVSAVQCSSNTKWASGTQLPFRIEEIWLARDPRCSQRRGSWFAIWLATWTRFGITPSGSR